MMPLPCCKKPGSRQLQNAIAQMFEEGKPRNRVQGFLDSICDKLGCKRTRELIHSTVKHSLPRTMTTEEVDATRDDVDALFAAIESCSVMAIIMAILQIIGGVAGRDAKLSVSLADLGDCVGDFTKFIETLQRLLDLINGNTGGGNACLPCPGDGGGGGGGGGGTTGFNPAGPDDNRGCS